MRGFLGAVCFAAVVAGGSGIAFGQSCEVTGDWTTCIGAGCMVNPPTHPYIWKGGNSYVFQNERGDRVDAYFNGEKFVIPAWRALATISKSCKEIDFGNGTSWAR